MSDTILIEFRSFSNLVVVGTTEVAATITHTISRLASAFVVSLDWHRVGTSNTNQARALGVLWGSREDSAIQMRARGVRLIGREDLFTESEFIDG